MCAPLCVPPCVYDSPLMNVLQVKAAPQERESVVSPLTITAESVTSATTTQVTKVTLSLFPWLQFNEKLGVCPVSSVSYGILNMPRASTSYLELGIKTTIPLITTSGFLLLVMSLLNVFLSACALQTVKGGYSETRIEKRIIITGDDDVDQHQVRRRITEILQHLHCMLI